MTLTIKLRGTRFECYVSAKCIITGKPIRDRKGGFERHKDAEEWGQDRLRVLQDPLASPRAKFAGITLGQPAEECWQRYWSRSKCPKSHRSVLDLVLVGLGADRLVTAITPQVIEDWIAQLQEDKGNSPGTINRKLSCLTRILRYSVRMGYLDKAPKIEWLPEDGSRLRYPSDAELDRVLAIVREKCREPRYAQLIEFLGETGLRVSEAIAYRPEWRHPTEPQFAVPGHVRKSKHPVTLPLTGRAQRILEALKDHQPGPFADLRADVLCRLWKKARVEMGLAEDKDFVPHSMRHRFASRLVQAGIPLPQVRDLMGHKSIKTTMIYSHLAPKNFQDSLAVLESLSRT